jgi:hypothetical protein
MKKFLLLAMTGLLVSACAAYQRVGIESAPDAAEVYLDGELVGTTPLELRVPTAADHSVYLKKEGFQPRMVVLDRHAPADGIDFVTPADVRVRLVPRTGMQDREVEVELDKEE